MTERGRKVIADMMIVATYTYHMEPLTIKEKQRKRLSQDL